MSKIIEINKKLKSIVEDKSIFLPELGNMIILMDNDVINGNHYYKGKNLCKISSKYRILENWPNIDFSVEFKEKLNYIFFNDLILRLMDREDCKDFILKYAKNFTKPLSEYTYSERIKFFKDSMDMFKDFKICVFTICVEPIDNVEIFCYDLYITRK